jgi:hypothetical protein
MEESVSSVDTFTWLPVGYMTASIGVNVPSNFIEVDGQLLSKQEYAEVYEVLRGSVKEDAENFFLPSKDEVKTLFSLSARIFIKVR